MDSPRPRPRPVRSPRSRSGFLCFLGAATGRALARDDGGPLGLTLLTGDERKAIEDRLENAAFTLAVVQRVLDRVLRELTALAESP